MLNKDKWKDMFYIIDNIWNRKNFWNVINKCLNRGM